MAEGVLMPKAGITVESCIIGQWTKKIGDTVAVGDILFTYETDKAEFECESTAAGTLLDIYFESGDEVPVLINVCAVGNPGEDTAGLRPEGGTAEEVTPAPVAEETPMAAAISQAVAASSDVVHGISPRAKNLAERAGVDTSYASATGPNGRVIERDIRRLMEEGVPVAAVVETAPVAAPVAKPASAFEDVKLSGIRKAISKSMVKSLSTMAQLTLNFSFDATQIQAYRKMLKGMEGDISKISLGDMVMFAVSKTLLNHKDLNANMLDDVTMRRFADVNLGFACDTDRGLMVPTIFDANHMSLLELSQSVKVLASDTKAGKASPDVLTGATFTVSNLGNLGCESFTPVINPPQTGILGICGMETKIKGVKDGNIETYQAMGLSLTFDHRVIDGAPAGRFMAELCKNLENFMTLLAM
ncbi:MAG: dihydrolipoamide acetyltransferase family protein [Eubacteriales bacterium]